MIDMNKDYTGKIIKIYCSYKGHPNEIVGLVQGQQVFKRSVSLDLLLLDGQNRTFNSRDFNFEKITSVRLDKDVRESLMELYQVTKEQDEFLKNFWKQKGVLEGRVTEARKKLNSFTGILSFSDFNASVKASFSGFFPCPEDPLRSRSFGLSFLSDTDFCIAHTQDVEKYASPEKFPFVYREYDGELFLSKGPALDAFCEKWAPEIIPQLKGKVEASVDASIGDKGWLKVSRIYRFPLKYGPTQRSIDYIKETFFEPKKEKSSLDSMISGAASKQTAQKIAPQGKKKSGQSR